jgi:hypothetical protein
MTREQYINFPAISASRIKRFYTGDINSNAAIKSALNKGADFHRQLLETEPNQMTKEAFNAYNAICSNAMLESLFNASDKEVPVVCDLAIPKSDGTKYEVKAKGMMDMVYPDGKVIVDIKTTTCKTIEAFASDMIKHYNHVQSVWYCLLMGYPLENFYYVGIPAKAKKVNSTSSDLFLYRHNDEELKHGLFLVYNFLDNFDGNYSK